VLHLLAQDQDEEVRMVVARNERTPGRVLRALATDGDEGVRLGVARNERMPEQVLHALAQDPAAAVRQQARLVQRVLSQSAEQPGELEPGRPLRRLLLSGLDRAGIVEAAIETQLGWLIHPTISAPVCQRLLALFAADWDAAKIQAAFYPRERNEVERFLEETLGRIREEDGRLLTTLMPPLALEKLAASPRWEVRYLVALHENSSWEVRHQLSQDGNRYVRAMARAKSERLHEPSRL
jgi:hypothetical protein